METIWIGYNFLIQKRIVSTETIWGNIIYMDAILLSEDSHIVMPIIFLFRTQPLGNSTTDFENQLFQPTIFLNSDKWTILKNWHSWIHTVILKQWCDKVKKQSTTNLEGIQLTKITVFFSKNLIHFNYQTILRPFLHTNAWIHLNYYLSYDVCPSVWVSECLSAKKTS